MTMRWIDCKICNRTVYTQNKIYCNRKCMAVGYLEDGNHMYGKIVPQKTRDIIRKKVGVGEENCLWKGGDTVERRKKYYAKYRESKLAYAKVLQSTEEFKAKRRARRRNAPPEVKAKLAEYARKWRAKNKDKVSEYNKKVHITHIKRSNG